MYIQLHSPLLGIFTILFLLVGYFMLMRTSKYMETIDKIGFTLMFLFAVAGVFAGGVLPFL